MPQSLVRNYIHIVFSTEKRFPFIGTDIEEELHRYLGGICNRLDCQVLTVGGFNDHVHIICMLSKKIALIDLIKELKVGSSHWIKKLGGMYEKFYWQDGYGAFSLNPTDIEAAIDYVNNQAEHHKQRSFQEELRAFLDKYKIQYNESYLWD